MQTPDERQAQLDEEREMARRLLNATAEERATLYASTYDRIFELSLPDREDDPQAQSFGAQPYMLDILERITRPGQRVLEVGCGTGWLSLELAKRGRRVVGLDVSQVAIRAAQHHADRMKSEGGEPPEFRVGSALQLDFDPASFDVVYTVEMFEHLHEVDAAIFMGEAFRVLKTGGLLWVQTPNHLVEISPEERFGLESGGHVTAEPDVHLKEWTYHELAPLFDRVGYERLTSFMQRRQLRLYPQVPLRVKLLTERVLEKLPPGKARRLLMYQLRVGECSILGRKG